MVSGTGEKEVDSATPRHDLLTDIRYIHNLWSYKHENPADTRYDSEIARYTPIIKAEFAHHENERGWLFDEFMAVYNLSNDGFYKETAYSMASASSHSFDPPVCSIYKKNYHPAKRSYPVDNSFE